jgi:hypothetical protein
MSTPPTREELIARLNERSAQLEQWFAARTPGEAERPLTASEVGGGEMWSAKDHLAHAIGTERYLAGVVRRTLEGAADPAGFYSRLGALDQATLMQAINQSNQAAYAKYHDTPLADLLTRQRDIRQATLALISAMSEEQLDMPSPHSPFGHGTVRDLFRQMSHHYQEHVHWLTTAWDEANRDA